jgi:hypothetical protein
MISVENHYYRTALALFAGFAIILRGQRSQNAAGFQFY